LQGEDASQISYANTNSELPFMFGATARPLSSAERDAEEHHASLAEKNRKAQKKFRYKRARNA
jgi:hypothetical protein